ncbi:Tyrosine recombinase XerC [Posidoniimonas corsicana]|uniref:Tyrosine recombinase XerC n=2 Tax=Posidoniimonas corsicana TaxID=1938618 RepID=A0A5C5VBK9_9BACT|nr:Tyrosine recombinase XerC [Posidoniimonas corsicana]
MERPREDDWLSFQQEFEDHHLKSQSKNYRASFVPAARKLENLCNPKRVSDVTPLMLARFHTRMREAGLANTTAASYLRQLRITINWAAEHGYLEQRVKVVVPRVDEDEEMKGRPLSLEELERLLKAAGKLLGVHAAPMESMLRGYWLSGLRRTEGYLLSWDNSEELLVVKIDGRRPMVEIPTKLDKGRKRRTLSLTPDFVEHLRSLPNREGRVYRPLTKQGRVVRSVDTLGVLISDIGATTNIVTKPGRHPTVHDLRRSFGERWAARVTPPVLKELMRHRDIKTTLKYYVGQSAERTANQVWDVFERSQGGVLGGAREPAAEANRS